MKPPLPEDVLAAWNRGDKIDALKKLREKTGLGLTEAKYLLESHAGSGSDAAPGAAAPPAKPGHARPGGLAPGEVRASRISASGLASVVIAAALAAYFIFRSG